MYPGLIRLLWLCKHRNIRIEIISHKTRLGHHDVNEVPLREKAEEFLRSKNVLGQEPDDLVSTIIFCDTRIDKINMILERQFDIFIDDLVEVLNHRSFPKTTRAFLFRPLGEVKKSKAFHLKSWFSLERILIPRYTVSDIKNFCNSMNLPAPNRSKQIHSGINSTVYEVAYEKNPLILKIYPNDGFHDRLKAELDALNLLARNGFTNIPSVVKSDKKLSLALQKKIIGKTNLEPTLSMVGECVRFINDIQELKQTAESKNIGIAKDACFSIEQTLDKIETRRATFNTINNQNLKKFLTEQFDPLHLLIKENVYSKYALSERRTEIDTISWVLSPSDFGFHNIIIDREQRLNFIDFEYFGWDDPVKLLVDFIFHPGFKLSMKGQRIWVESSLTSYAKGFEKRFVATWPLYGLLWILVVLNLFKIDAISKTIESSVLYKQLEKAEKLYNWINENTIHDLREVLVGAR